MNSNFIYTLTYDTINLFLCADYRLPLLIAGIQSCKAMGTSTTKKNPGNKLLQLFTSRKKENSKRMYLVEGVVQAQNVYIYIY